MIVKRLFRRPSLVAQSAPKNVAAEVTRLKHFADSVGSLREFFWDRLQLTGRLPGTSFKPASLYPPLVAHRLGGTPGGPCRLCSCFGEVFPGCAQGK